MSSSPPKVARAAIAQLCSTNNKVKNLINIAKCAGWAKRDGASMLFLPECFGFMGENAAETVKKAEPPIEEIRQDSNNGGQYGSIYDMLASTVSDHSSKDEIIDGKGEDEGIVWDKSNEVGENSEKESILLDGLRAIARESGLWISGGGVHMSGAPPAPLPPDEGSSASTVSDTTPRSRVYNTHVIIDNMGNINCVYRKAHLFDVSIPGKVNLKESATTAPGKQLVVCDSPIGRLGLSTCYDVRFPEMYVELVQKGGAEVLLVPSAFTVPTGSAHWQTLLQARAIENQCYVLAAAQFGRHNARRESYGHSLAVDPWGAILADAGGYDGPGTTGHDGKEWSDKHSSLTPSIVTCDIDLDSLQTVRERMPIQQHREDSSFSF